MSALGKAKNLYLATSLREKLLVLAFILVALSIWSQNWLGRVSTWNDDRKTNVVDLSAQQQWLDRNEEFSAGLDRALERVDPANTKDASELSRRVDDLLRGTGISRQADIDAVRTRDGEIFNDHNVRIQLKRVTITQLVNFNTLLEQDNPYINIQSIRIKPIRNKEELLDVRYELNSLELKEGSF